MKEDKKRLRKESKDRLNQIDDKTYHKWSSEIAERLFQTPMWQQSRIIGITLSQPREIHTYSIIEKAWAQNKIIVVPQCLMSTKEMIFRRIDSFDQIVEASYGIKEPIEAETPVFSHEEIDLLVVPGLLFTKTGYRLGFGGGFYDRYLEKYKGRMLSLAFELQLTKTLPIDSFDLPVETIITEKRIVTCNEHI